MFNFNYCPCKCSNLVLEKKIFGENGYQLAELNIKPRETCTKSKTENNKQDEMEHKNKQDEKVNNNRPVKRIGGAPFINELSTHTLSQISLTFSDPTSSKGSLTADESPGRPKTQMRSRSRSRSRGQGQVEQDDQDYSSEGSLDSEDQRKNEKETPKNINLDSDSCQSLDSTY